MEVTYMHFSVQRGCWNIPTTQAFAVCSSSSVVSLFCSHETWIFLFVEENGEW